MGVLDELKKEAEAVSARKSRETTARAEMLAQARAQIEPRMQALYKYFSDLKHYLQMIEREITASYYIKDAGRVDGLIQGQYSVATERPEQIQKFSFRCVCAKPGALQVNQSDAVSVAAYRDYLRDNALQAKVRDLGRGAASFMVQTAVAVVVEFSSDVERLAIRLRLRNLNAIGVTHHVLSVEQVDDGFMDEVARALLRQSNRLAERMGDELSETGKGRLKRRMQAALRQQQIDDELAAHARERTITGRLGRTLLGRKD